MGGALAGRMVKFVVEQDIKEEIRNFKRLMETGELPTTKGQSSGRRKEWQESQRLDNQNQDNQSQNNQWRNSESRPNQMQQETLQ
jgi:hypothetical protein